MHPDNAAGIRLFRSKICPSDQGCMPVWAMMHSGRLLPQVSTDFVKLHAIPGVFAKFDIYDENAGRFQTKLFFRKTCKFILPFREVID